MILLLGLFVALVIPALGCSGDGQDTDHEQVDSSTGPSGNRADSRIVGVDAASHTTEPGGSRGGASTEVDSGSNSDTAIDSGSSTDSDKIAIYTTPTITAAVVTDMGQISVPIRRPVW